MRSGFSMGVGCVAVALCLTSSALAQAPPKGEAVLSSAQVTATVEKIDQKTREVTLKTDDGQEYTFVAGDAVQNLAQVKKGDVVTATYTEAVAYEVKKGGTAGAMRPVAGGTAAPGAKPAGAIGQKVTVTVAIAAIDTKAPSVTFKAAGRRQADDQGDGPGEAPGRERRRHGRHHLRRGGRDQGREGAEEVAGDRRKGTRPEVHTHDSEPQRRRFRTEDLSRPVIRLRNDDRHAGD